MKPVGTRFILFLFFVLVHFTSFCQPNPDGALDSLVISQYLRDYEKEYSKNKSIPKEHSLSFYTAISHYPELKETYISFKRARIKTTLNARPTVASLLFRKRNNRRYVIRINSKERDSLILLDQVPFNARIGLFGHELAHFADYNERSFGGVLKRMMSYTTKKGKERYEKEIDQKTIDAGLGWQLYDWSHFVLYRSNGNFRYKEYKSIVYLEPEEIIEIMRSAEKL